MRITKNILLTPIAILFLSSCANFPSEGIKKLEFKESERLETKSNAVNFITCKSGDLNHEIVINTTDGTSEISLDDSGVFFKGTYNFDRPKLRYFISYFVDEQEFLKYQIPVFSNLSSIFEFPEIKNKDGGFIISNPKGIVNTQFYTKCVLTDVIPR